MGNKNKRDGPPDVDVDSVLKLVDIVVKDVKDLSKLVRDGGNGFPPLIARALVNEKAIEALTKRQTGLETAMHEAIQRLETHSQEQHSQLHQLLENKREEAQIKSAMGPARLHSRTALRTVLIQGAISLVIAVITLVSYHYFWSHEATSSKQVIEVPEERVPGVHHFSSTPSGRKLQHYFGTQADIDNLRVTNDLNQLSRDLSKRKRDREAEKKKEMAKQQPRASRTSNPPNRGYNRDLQS